MRIAFIDTETTGLDPAEHELIDFAGCIWTDGVQAPWMRRRYLPHGPLDPGAQRVNGYTPELWAQEYAPDRTAGYFTAADAEEIAAFLSQGDMIGGAATHFDIAMLKSAFRRVRVPWPSSITHRVVDVQPLAVPLVLMGQLKSVSLGALAERFGLGTVAHTAPADVSLTIAVFEKLIEFYWPALQGVAA